MFENENYSKTFSYIFRTISFLAIIIVLCDISIKLGIIKRHYQSEYKCRLLLIEKSKSIYAKILLYFISFIEAIFFPIPVDPLLAILVLKIRLRWHYQ